MEFIKPAYCVFKLIRLHLSLISLLLAPPVLVHAAVGNEYKEFIYMAFKNTYREGGLKYEIKSRSLSDRDTVTTQSSITIFNSNKGIDFTAINNDSLMIVYFDNQLLYVNPINNTYNKVEVKQHDIEDNIEILYLPLLQKKFGKTILSGKSSITKIGEDNKNIVFKIGMSNSGDIGNIFSIISISKLTNSIVKYSLSATVYNVSIWEEYSLLSLESLNDSDAVIIISESYSDIITNYNYRTIKKPSDNPDSMRVEINLLANELPNYDLVSIEGDTFKLNNMQSKYHLVDFWYRSCYPCLKVMPVLKELEGKYTNAEFNIVSINPVDKNFDTIKDYIHNNSIPYEVYTSSVQKGRKFRGVNSYPLLILYDSNFNVISFFHGYSDDLQRRIEELISN